MTRSRLPKEHQGLGHGNVGIFTKEPGEIGGQPSTELFPPQGEGDSSVAPIRCDCYSSCALSGLHALSRICGSQPLMKLIAEHTVDPRITLPSYAALINACLDEFGGKLSRALIEAESDIRKGSKSLLNDENTFREIGSRVAVHVFADSCLIMFAGGSPKGQQSADALGKYLGLNLPATWQISVCLYGGPRCRRLRI